MHPTVQLLLFCALAGMVSCKCDSDTDTKNTYCWTRWLDRDNPSGYGDYETYNHFPQSQVCPRPVGIECQTTSGQPFQSTGERVTCEPQKGLVCVNSKQKNKRCQDYRVRFLCPSGTISDTRGVTCKSYCPTRWLNRDRPSGYCDCEALQHFTSAQTCKNPVGVKCRETSTRKDYRDVGQNMVCNTHFGGVCWNSQNPGSYCKDYEVQFLCPCNQQEENEELIE